jgi:hypothetical protein
MKWWVESDFKAPNLPLSLRFKSSQNNVKTKVLLSQEYVTLVDFYYHVPFGFLVPNKFQISWLSNILALSVPEEGYRRHATTLPIPPAIGPILLG